jgi:hypothetical protein
MSEACLIVFDECLGRRRSTEELSGESIIRPYFLEIDQHRQSPVGNLADRYIVVCVAIPRKSLALPLTTAR